MSRRIVADSAAYRAAAAELPRAATLAADPTGAVVVVPDFAAVGRAIDRGAGVVVVADATLATAADVAELAANPRPIVVARPRLRADVADAIRDAARPACPILADIAAPRPMRTAAVADAVGWIRILAGGAPTVRAADAAGVALLDAARGEPVSMSVATVSGRGASVRIETLGDERVAVAADDPNREVIVTTTAESGAYQAPRPWETIERLSLRRALAALDGAPVTDVPDLAADLRVAESVLRAG